MTARSRALNPVFAVAATRAALASALLGGLAPAAGAQGSVVVPAARATKDAPRHGWFAGLTTKARQQILIGSRHLAAFRGRKLTGIAVRRDMAFAGPLGGGRAALEIVVSTSMTLDPDAPSERFDANHGPKPGRVFRGVVGVPASPPVGRRAPWAPSDTVSMSFSVPFPYAGGTLCIECRGAPVPGRESTFWPVDYESDLVSGSAQLRGATCVGGAVAGPVSAVAWPGTLRPGATAIFQASARPGTDGFLLLGVRPLGGARGVALAPFGAPGCALYVDAMVDVPVPFGAPFEPGANAHGAATILLPKTTGLLGATLLAQWVHTEWRLPRWTNRLGLTTSNLIVARIASRPTTLGLATVFSRQIGPRPPARGTVRVGTAPVLRLSWR